MIPFGAAFLSEPELDRWEVQYDAHSASDVYLSSYDATMLDGFSINRPCGDMRLWDALASILALGNFVLYFLLGKLFSSNYPGGTYAATVAFVALWWVIAGANLWLSVAKAGYTLDVELPICLLFFAVPTAVTIFLRWRIL